MNLSTQIFLLSLASVLFCWLVSRIASRYATLPEFAWNKIGGTLAIVGIADYEKAKLFGRHVAGKVIVRDISVHVQHKGAPSSDADRAWLHAPDLFVPFTSERHLSAAEQEQIFRVAKDWWQFVDAQRRHNAVCDRRLALVKWVRESELLTWVWVGSSIIAAFSFIAVGMVLNSDNDGDKKEPATIYTTDMDGVRKTETTKADLRKHRVYSEVLSEDMRIYPGIVVEIVPLSSEFNYDCIERQHAKLCGMASKSVKLGEKLYNRQMQGYVGPGLGMGGYFTPINFLITKSEAEALVATGDFKIVE